MTLMGRENDVSSRLPLMRRCAMKYGKFILLLNHKSKKLDQTFFRVNLKDKFPLWLSVSPPDFLCVTDEFLGTFTELHRESTEFHREKIMLDLQNK